jgi:hypothetical protein
MLMAHTPALFGASGFLAPAQANGNDSYTVSLLHMDAPDTFNGVFDPALSGFKDYAYGAPPSRRNAWTITTGSPYTVTSLPFNQAGVFAGAHAIACPDAPDLTPNGDYTIDFWFAYSSTAIGGADIIGKRLDAGSVGPFLFYQADTRIMFYASSGAGWDIASGVVAAGPGIAANTWYHFACVKQGNTYKFYVNGGLQGATVTSALMPVKNTAPLRIGGFASSLFSGYIDEFRFSNGIARWTANFTPPNQPYYARLDQGGNDDATKLLLHFDKDTFVIDSARGGKSTPHGVNNFAVQLGSPNNAALTQNVMAVGGGTQRVVIPASNDFNMMRGNFTLDFWYYRTGSANSHVIARRNSGSEFGSFFLTDTGDGIIHLYMTSTGTGWDLYSNSPMNSTPIPLNTWTHLALQRIGNTLWFFVNGTVTYGNGAFTATLWNNSNVLSIGGMSDGSSNSAYFDEVRYSDVARYAGNFTRPTQPYGPTPVVDLTTLLLLHMDGPNGLAKFPDASAYGRTPVFIGSTTKVSTAQSKFGGASAGYDGNSASYISFPSSAELNFGSGDFTLECWVRFNSVASYCGLLGKWVTADGRRSWSLRWQPPNLQLSLSPGGATQVSCALPWSPTTGVWYHVAAVRTGGFVYLFINGTLLGSPIADTTNLIATSEVVSIGGDTSGSAGVISGPMNGYIDEARISNVARWTANFTPPTVPYS